MPHTAISSAYLTAPYPAPSDHQERQWPFLWASCDRSRVVTIRAGANSGISRGQPATPAEPPA